MYNKLWINEEVQRHGAKANTVTGDTNTIWRNKHFRH